MFFNDRDLHFFLSRRTHSWDCILLQSSSSVGDTNASTYWKTFSKLKGSIHLSVQTHRVLFMYVTEGRRSSLGLMQSLPHPEVCRVKIYALWLMIFYSHSFQPASLPANPPTPALLGFMCRQTKTLTRTETCAVIWSHLMVKEGNGSNIFTRKIGS